MKSQSTEYPTVTQYSDTEIAVPINITQGTHPETGDYYEFDVLLIQASSPTSIDAYVNTAQAIMDSKMQERGYDGILSACTYATSSVSQFATEGQAAVTWRDSVWAKCYEILNAVTAGQRQQPTLQEFIDELPAFTWPE